MPTSSEKRWSIAHPPAIKPLITFESG
jgi:hypothetical protein